MSNRTEADITFAAELKAAHLAQIEALTMRGLTREERVERFMEAARFTPQQCILRRFFSRPDYWRSAANIVWFEGHAPFSLFANMPGCNCPVVEVAGGATIDGVPDDIPDDWNPTVEDLLPFARIQQERRIKGDAE